MLNFKEPVGRTQSPDTLVRTLVVVILDPEGRALCGILKAAKLRPLQKLALDRFPEADGLIIEQYIHNRTG